jgi:hypothetical protein
MQSLYIETDNALRQPLLAEETNMREENRMPAKKKAKKKR